MSTPLRVLILEDRPDDAKLMLHELRRAGFEPDWQRVETEPDYLAALDPALEVILADYALPQFDAPRALLLLHKRGLDIPFIVVTGSISEEVAVEFMKQGAADYLLKDRLTRLGQAVTRALEQKRQRDEKRRADQALRESEAQYRLLAENMSDTVWLMDLNLRTSYISPSVIRTRGFTLDEINALPLDQQMPPDSLARAMELFAEALSPENLERPDPRTTYSVELEFYRKNGDKFWSENVFTLILDQNKQPINILGTGRDITERKRAEETIQQRNEELTALYRLARILGDADDRATILSLIVRCAVETAQVTFARITLLDRNDFVIQAGHSIRALDRDLRVGMREPLADHPLCQRALEQNEPIVINRDDPAVTPQDRTWLFLDQAQTLCMVPLRSGENTLGVLMLGDERRIEREPFDEAKIRMARNMGDEAASALRRVGLREETEKQLHHVQALHIVSSQ
jgi:PAS domain S-box-containing protein